MSETKRAASQRKKREADEKIMSAARVATARTKKLMDAVRVVNTEAGTVETKRQRTKRLAEEKAVTDAAAKKDRHKRNNETLISLRIERDKLDAFEHALIEAETVAHRKGVKLPTRSAMARAAVAYMLANWKKDRKAWIDDVLAAA